MREREPSSLTLREQNALARAVRATVHGQVVDLLERRGLVSRSDLVDCPVCGDRIILLDQPATFVYDRDRRARICSACAAERDFVRMIDLDNDIGGEGGA